MEAVLHGVPSFAVSLATRKYLDFSGAAAFAAQLAAKVLEEGLPEGVMLNMHYPSLNHLSRWLPALESTVGR
jgi:5'-nucleotidase